VSFESLTVRHWVLSTPPVGVKEVQSRTLTELRFLAFWTVPVIRQASRRLPARLIARAFVRQAVESLPEAFLVPT
jgi:hypothetical protein